jgi:hypothetical protein
MFVMMFMMLESVQSACLLCFRDAAEKDMIDGWSSYTALRVHIHAMEALV